MLINHDPFISTGEISQQMATSMSAEKITGAVFSAILIFYLIANTFNDAGSELESVNESLKGGKIIKLLPLFLAFGVVIGIYRMMTKK